MKLLNWLGIMITREWIIDFNEKKVVRNKEIDKSIFTSEFENDLAFFTSKPLN